MKYPDILKLAISSNSENISELSVWNFWARLCSQIVTVCVCVCVCAHPWAALCLQGNCICGAGGVLSSQPQQHHRHIEPCSPVWQPQPSMVMEPLKYTVSVSHTQDFKDLIQMRECKISWIIFTSLYTQTLILEYIWL